MEGFNFSLWQTVAFPLGFPQTKHESTLSSYLISTYGAQYYEECGRDRYHCSESLSSSCTCLEKQVSDKNSLFDRGRIGEMALWVKAKTSQHIAMLDNRVQRILAIEAKAGQVEGNWKGKITALT
jgi:type II secretory pathway component PulL